MITSANTVYRSFAQGKLVPPEVWEDLYEGIRWANQQLGTHGHHNGAYSALMDWLDSARALLSLIAAPPPPLPPIPPPKGIEAWIPPGTFFGIERTPHKPEKLPPQICTSCKFKNDYAGHEHLQPNGTYLCRSCKS